MAATKKQGAAYKTAMKKSAENTGAAKKTFGSGRSSEVATAERAKGATVKGAAAKTSPAKERPAKKKPSKTGRAAKRAVTKVAASKTATKNGSAGTAKRAATRSSRVAAATANPVRDKWIARGWVPPPSLASPGTARAISSSSGS
jgi:hypothetical protein